MISTLHNKIRLAVRYLPERVHAWNDYRIYARSIGSFKKYAMKLPKAANGSLLIVSGRGMNVMWAQIWTALSLTVRLHGYRGIVLTTRAQRHLNRYFKLLNLDLIYYDDLVKIFPRTLPAELEKTVSRAATFSDYKDISFKGVPIGEIALSTYTRYHGTGVIDFGKKEVIHAIREWIHILYQGILIAEHIYREYDVKNLFVAEIFFEEYGAFYFTAISSGLNIIKFTGTVRDDAFILQHLTEANARMHHASLTPQTWNKVKNLPFPPEKEAALHQNFLDRYGNKWHRSKRNHPLTRMMTVQDARRSLGIEPDRKVAVVFSHILYDSLYFFGTDLFRDYSEWLVETVRAACQNPALDWLIKVHPSNLWRGELNTLLKGKYEEERLIGSSLGELPRHVRIVTADTKINPYTWFQLADYGITVRGTSGLEMAALGRTVITAGTGRYEGNGFTIDPPDRQSYLDVLKRLPEIPPLTQEQIGLAKRYAHALFVLKPFTLTSLVPRLKSGVKQFVASDDIVYLPASLPDGRLPDDLSTLAQWALNRDELELISY